VISVVVPAHDEEAVLGRCLAALTEGARDGELEIVVVCNGCRDDTAAIAHGFGPPVAVIESQVASKSAALNLGHRTARGYPRFFVDADIVLPLAAIRKVAAVLERGDVLAAAPRIEVDLSRCTRPVRAYYAVWQRTPYVTSVLLVSGVYAISPAGGHRLDEFPDLVADDAFVRQLFRPEERALVDGCRFRMTPPRTLQPDPHQRAAPGRTRRDGPPAPGGNRSGGRAAAGLARPDARAAQALAGAGGVSLREAGDRRDLPLEATARP